MKKSGTAIITWALITTLVMDCCIFGMYLAGILNIVNQLTDIVILFGGLFMVMHQYRKAMKVQNISFAELYKIGMYMTVLFSVIYSICFILFLHLNPAVVEHLTKFAYNSEQMKRGDVQDNIELNKTILGFVSSPEVMGISKCLVHLIEGAVLSLITAAMLSKSQPADKEDKISPQI